VPLLQVTALARLAGWSLGPVQACLARDDVRILALLLPPGLQLPPQPQPQPPQPPQPPPPQPAQVGAGVEGGEVRVDEEGALLLQLCVRHGAAACALLVCSRLRLCEHPPPRALLESLLRDALAVDAPAQRRVAQALVLLTPTLT